MIEITSREKVSMFLIEYYFGYNSLISAMRIIGGPFVIFLGGMILFNEIDTLRLTIAFFVMLFGTFMIFRPFLIMLFSINNFKNEKIKLKVQENELVIEGTDISEKIEYSLIQQILSRKTYYCLLLKNGNRIKIPKTVINWDLHQKISAKL